MEKYKALSDPGVTAQERYLAEIARRSFEAQDRGSREAVLSDQSARGVRSGASEIASALGNQERFGQDRTLAELGLQANAVQRSMVALGGWQQSADSLRAAQQNGLAMYTQGNNALRAAQQQGMAMAADEENALRQAQQQGLAMYQQAADSIRAMNDQVGLANTGWANQNEIANAGFSNENSMFNANANNQANQFNANAYNENSMFNANAYNQNSQFNANANNNAMANNQSTRVQGGVAMNNTANSIRNANDAIGMFNTNGSQVTQRFNAGMAFDKATSIYGIGQDTFNNETGVTDTAANRSGALASSTWSIPSTTADVQDTWGRRMNYSPYDDDEDLDAWITQQANDASLSGLLEPDSFGSQPMPMYQAPPRTEMAPLNYDTGPDWSDALGAGTTALAALADLGLNKGKGTGQILAAGGQFGQARAEQRLRGTQDAIGYEQQRARMQYEQGLRSRNY